MIKNILLVNKPINFTSFDVCNKIKKRYKEIKKIGHAGTLDPKASGLLILGINDGTKLLTNLVLDEKEYIATIKFNIETETYDSEGLVLATTNEKVSLDDLKKIIRKYNHKYFYQYPPIYSAIKIKGKKLYEYARNKKSVELPKRKVYTNEISLLSFDFEKQIAVVKLSVSKGFYVRSFAHDIGKELNNLAYLSSLIRTKSGNFLLSNAYDLDEILNNERLIKDY